MNNLINSIAITRIDSAIARYFWLRICYSSPMTTKVSFDLCHLTFINLDDQVHLCALYTPCIRPVYALYIAWFSHY
jgi:hypothetical protein